MTETTLHIKRIAGPVGADCSASLAQEATIQSWPGKIEEANPRILVDVHSTRPKIIETRSYKLRRKVVK
jgi:hypothetical protein